MWETFGEVLTSGNAFIVLFFLAFITLMAWGMARAGLFNIHTDAVTVGAQDRERQIIRVQLEWIMRHLLEVEASIEKPKGYNEWRGRYIVECLYDYWVDRITQNHIKISTEYVEIVQSNVLAIVSSMVERPEYRTEEFNEMMKEDTKFCIEKLIQIRKVYSK